MAKPSAMILKEHGTNCEHESRYAFEKAGARADIVHMEDLIRNKEKLFGYQILMLPGGFSYGDDMGSGMAWANRIRNNLWEELLRYIEGNHLVLGVCNGFQVLVNLGIVPALDNRYEQQVALIHNDSTRYNDRWVDLEHEGYTPWLRDIGYISLPIAHAEGRFYADKDTLRKLKHIETDTQVTFTHVKSLVALRYVKGHVCRYENLPANPNGSIDDIAGLTNISGNVLGMMPHPERAIEFTQLPNWGWLKREFEESQEGPGLKLFKNGVSYFK